MEFSETLDEVTVFGSIETVGATVKIVSIKKCFYKELNKGYIILSGSNDN